MQPPAAAVSGVLLDTSVFSYKSHWMWISSAKPDESWPATLPFPSEEVNDGVFGGPGELRRRLLVHDVDFSL